MKTVKGRNKESAANKGVPVKKKMAPKGMGKGVRKAKRPTEKQLGDY